MTKTDELLKEFAEKWGGSVAAEGYGSARFDVSEQCLADLRTLIAQVEEERMPSEEVVRETADAYNNYPYEIKDYAALFRSGAVWFRKYMKGKE